uniref:Uncharacterized protein n=1 Tax=Octopus bimaculoides TaxID=37653 RepID=A0A0L8GD00_OCTBM
MTVIGRIAALCNLRNARSCSEDHVAVHLPAPLSQGIYRYMNNEKEAFITLPLDLNEYKKTGHRCYTVLTYFIIEIQPRKDNDECEKVYEISGAFQLSNQPLISITV